MVVLEQGVVERDCHYSGCSVRVNVPVEFDRSLRAAGRLPMQESCDVLRGFYGPHEEFFCGATGNVFCSERCHNLMYDD
ncbi:MAG: hypothetical protein ABIH92_04805 [Nanoarchaeota archaeon]